MLPRAEFCLSGRRSGKTMMVVETVRHGLTVGRRVLVATPNQAETARMLLQFFPGALAEIVGDIGIVIHRKHQGGLHA